MSPEVIDLLERALELSPAERASLAGSLIDSLDTDIDADAETAWEGEVTRRLAELDAGGIQVVPWAKARKQIIGETSQ